jgi:hypothetical protein
MTQIAGEVAYKRNAIERDRHRLSKELAQELKDQMGDGAYLFCVEKLSGNTEQPKLWRDVLTWLTETETTKGETNERS